MAYRGSNMSIVDKFRFYFKKRSFIKQHLKRIGSEIRHNTSIEDILINSTTLKLFYKYLEAETGSCSRIMRSLECYDFCDDFLCDQPTLIDYELSNILYASSEKWQLKLKSEIENSGLSPTCKLLTLLIDLRNELILELEISNEYNDFKKNLLNKSRKIRKLLKDIYSESCFL